MKLLFDQNLSHKLPMRLADLFPNSEHVRAIGLDHAPDRAIWEYARMAGFAIVTQDADFTEISRLVGSPPKVIWIHCGNTSPQHVERVLRLNAQIIHGLESSRDQHFLEIIQ